MPFYHCDDEECDAPPLFVNAEKLWGKLWWSMIPVKHNPPWLHSVPQAWVERCLAEAPLIVPLASRHQDCWWLYPRLCTNGSSVLTDWPGMSRYLDPCRHREINTVIHNSGNRVDRTVWIFKTNFFKRITFEDHFHYMNSLLKLSCSKKNWIIEYILQS